MKSYGIQQKISMKEKSPDNGEKEVTEKMGKTLIL